MLAFAPPLTHATTSDSHSSATALRPRSTPRAPSNASTSSSSSSSIGASSHSLHRASSKPSFPARSSGHRRAESSSTRTVDHNPCPDRPPPTTSYTNPSPYDQTITKPRAVHGPLEKLREQDASKLLQLLASLLQQIALANDRLRSSQSQTNDETINQSHEHATSPVQRPPIWSTLTSASREAFSTTSSCLTFHARNVPTISLEAYLLRILKYCPTTNEVFLSLLVYFDRMSKLAFDATGKTFAIDSYNVHRLVIAGVTVASKFFSDVFYTNSRYAKVGGLPQTELNQLELQFLLLNNFRLSIGVDEFQRYAEQLQIYAQNTEAGLEPKPLNSESDIYARSPQDLISTSIRQMGASVDSVTRDSVTTHDAPQDRQPKVNGSLGGSVDAPPHVSQSSENLETEDEDGETDDEPTIRGHSSASSETQSLCTVESEESYSEADGIDDGDHRTPEHSATMSPMSP